MKWVRDPLNNYITFLTERLIKFLSDLIFGSKVISDIQI